MLDSATKKRFLEEKIQKSLSFFPITLIQGSRQSGKSFLLKKLLEQGLIRSLHTLDDLGELELARQNPHDYIERLAKPAGIDEIQRVPELMLALKKYVDEHQKKGDFVVSSSANIFSYPTTLESLAGRMNVLTLEPLSFAEAHNHEISRIFEELLDDPDVDLGKIVQQKELCFFDDEPILRGGFPAIVNAPNEEFRHDWFSSYISAYIERDLRELAKDMLGFYRLFQYLAFISGQQMVINSMTNDLGLDQRTLKRYIEILEMTFQIDIIQPFYSNQLKSLVKTPKIFFKDTGLLSYLCHFSTPEHLAKSPLRGALLETWLYNEIRKNISDKRISINYFRQHNGMEVDFVLSKGLSSHVFIECKSTLPTSLSSLKALETLRAFSPQSPVLIFHSGKEFKQFGHRIYGVPFFALG